MSCSECRGYVGVSCPVCGSELVRCPVCKGRGYAGPFYAFNIVTRKDVAVTYATWASLPPSEEEAEGKRLPYCRQDVGPCRECGGSGVVVR